MNKKRRKHRRKKTGHQPSRVSVQPGVAYAQRSLYWPERQITQARADKRPDQMKPPKFGEHLLYLVLPKETSECTIGDLTQHYRRLQPKVGTRKARIWYYSEVGILLLGRLPRVINRIFYAWVEDFMCRHI